MENTLIKVDCVDQRLLISTAPVLASGGINEDVVEFHFCPLWEGFAKTAIFYRDEASVYYAVVGSDDRCTIPAEVLQSDGDMFFGVFGTSGSVTRTSEILRYKIKLGAITENLKPSEPTPDIYIQLLAALSAMDNKVDKIDGKGLSTNDYTDAEKTKLSGIADGATKVIIDDTLEVTGRAADAKKTGDRLGAVEAFTIEPQEYELTGNPVQLNNYEGMPLNVITTLEPIQAGSGDPSPTNIRAISGRTGLTLTQSRKNLCNDKIRYPDIAFVMPAGNTGKTLYFKSLSDSGSSQVNAKFTRSDGTSFDIALIPANAENGVWYSTSYIIDASDVSVSIVELDATNTRTGLQIMASLEDIPYEPYVGDTYAADFGQTVYGGTMDWLTGVLTVDRAVRAFDGTEVWGYTGTEETFPRFGTFALGGNVASDIAGNPSRYASSHFKSVGSLGEAKQNGNGLYVYDGGYIDIICLSITSLDDWKSYLAAQYAAGTPVQVCYKLATPTTIQLTPHEILALNGVNTLYGNGTLNVSGRKDILWLTSRLIERIKTLESAVISLGGNV